MSVDFSDAVLVFRYGIAIAAGGLVARGVISQACINEAMSALAQTGLAAPTGSVMAFGAILWGLVTRQQSKAAVVDAAATGVAKQATVTSSISPSAAGPSTTKGI
jgi:hypothetical protein